MITLKKIYQLLTKNFSLSCQEKWDKSGIIRTTNWSTKINSIIICLDLTTKILNKAIQTNTKLIISHHPIFLKNKEVDNVNKSIFSKLKNKKINLISLHTNVDNNKKGLNYYLLNKLGAFNIKLHKNINGIYFSGYISKTSLKKIISKLKNKFMCYQIKYINNSHNNINKIILCCGSGFSVLKKTINNSKPNVAFITGDIKWHDWIYASQFNVNLIDAGHEIEMEFINMISSLIRNTKENDNLKIINLFPDIEFNFS